MMTEELFKQYWEARRKEIEETNPNRQSILITDNKETIWKNHGSDNAGKVCSVIYEGPSFADVRIVDKQLNIRSMFLIGIDGRERCSDLGIEKIKSQISKYITSHITKLHEESKRDDELRDRLKEVKTIHLTIYIDDSYIIDFPHLDGIRITDKSVEYKAKYRLVIRDSYIGDIPMSENSNVKSIIILNSCVKLSNSSMKRLDLYKSDVTTKGSIVEIDFPVNITINNDNAINEEILKAEKENHSSYLRYFINSKTYPVSGFVFLHDDRYGNNNYGTIGFRKNKNSSSNFLLLKNIGLEKITLDNMNLSEDFLYLTTDKAENITPFNPENASFIACTLDDANFINVANPRLKMDLIKRFRHVFNKDVYFREAEILQHEELRLQIANFEKPEWLQKMSDKLKRTDNYMKKVRDCLKQKCLTIIVKIIGFIRFILFEIKQGLAFVLKCMCVSRGKSEYLIILFSDYFSDFGKSLWRPFRLLLFIALFFFLMTHCSGYLGKYNFSLSGELLFGDFLADMFSAMIALPSLIDFQNHEFFATGWAKLCNIISFIIIKFLTGYLLYNFIRATRRYK
jgi:hypothetical protein